MLTFYCPECWSEISSLETLCPYCGFELARDQAKSYEEKLLRSLKHPAPEIRYLAVQILGKLGSRAALPEFNTLLGAKVNDIYLLQYIVEALSMIRDPYSQELLKQATEHPYPIIQHLAKTFLERRIMSKSTQIILVRHGQTEWNRVERFRGRADVPLNKTGLIQAEATGQRVAAEWVPKAIYSSPLSRAINTAEAIARHFDLAVQVHPGLIDIDYGDWQGLTPDEAHQRWPLQVTNWYNCPEQAMIPSGETLAELRTRAMQTINELAERHTGETIVAVGHTVINRIILLGVLGLGNDRFWRIKQDTCAINLFEVEQGGFILASLNDTCHLHLEKLP